jgi:hypothetical protein
MSCLNLAHLNCNIVSDFERRVADLELMAVNHPASSFHNQTLAHFARFSSLYAVFTSATTRTARQASRKQTAT